MKDLAGQFPFALEEERGQRPGERGVLHVPLQLIRGLLRLLSSPDLPFIIHFYFHWGSGWLVSRPALCLC